MTRVDFYLQPSDNPTVRYKLACRLAEKAYRLENTVLIQTESGRQNKIMDDLLWTFRPGSFIPHGLATGGEADRKFPVIITHEQGTFGLSDVLINLSPEIPEDFSRFKRIIELVNQDNSVRDAGRKRYRYYKQQGFQIETHKIDHVR